MAYPEALGNLLLVGLFPGKLARERELCRKADLAAVNVLVKGLDALVPGGIQRKTSRDGGGLAHGPSYLTAPQ